MASCNADRRLYLTRDRKRIVEHGDPEAAILFCAAGRQVTDAEMSEYGLRFHGDRIVLPSDLKQDEQDVSVAVADVDSSEKSMAKPEDKSAAKSEDKSTSKRSKKSS